jgi:hypothetical protein
MSRFIEGESRSQSVLFPERLEVWIAEDNRVRAVDAFVEALALSELGFGSTNPADTGRPSYHPRDIAEDLHIRLPESYSIEPLKELGATVHLPAGIASICLSAIRPSAGFTPAATCRSGSLASSPA